MRRASNPRTEKLLRAYIALLAISVVLAAAVVERRIAAARHGGEEVIITQSRETPAPRHTGPTINWGGQKR